MKLRGRERHQSRAARWWYIYIRFFSCSNYSKDYRGTCPTRHYIRRSVEQAFYTA